MQKQICTQVLYRALGELRFLLGNMCNQLCIFGADAQVLCSIFEQIRGAFTVPQFEEVKSKILMFPQSIIDEGTSTLQVQAAKLQVNAVFCLTPNNLNFLRPMISQIRIAGYSRAISRLSTRLKCLELLAQIKGRNHKCHFAMNETGNLLRSDKQLILRSSVMVESIHSRFQDFIHSTDFLSVTRPNWLKHISRFRNALQNKVARFEIARGKAAEYRCALAALEEGEESDEDMAFELRLRNAALDAYVACLDRMEASQADFTAEFVGHAKDELGNISRRSPPWYPDEILLSIDIHGLQWSFGALDVLNRVSSHFFVSCGPGRDVVESYRTLRQMPQDQMHQLYQKHKKLTNLGQAGEDAPAYYDFLAETRTACAARAQLEETARMLQECAGPLCSVRSLGPHITASSLSSPFDDSNFYMPFNSDNRHCSRRTDHANYWWSSGLSHPDVCELMSAEALAPTFASFPDILVPALIRVEPDESMGRTARLHTRATPPQLLAWGFDTDHGRGIASVSLRRALEETDAELEKIHVLTGPQAKWGQLRQEASRQAGGRQSIQQQEGWAELARAEAAGCPGDIWDEPPNDYWHPLAAAAADREWSLFEAAALDGPGHAEPRLRRHGRGRCDGDSGRRKRRRGTRIARMKDTAEEDLDEEKEAGGPGGPGAAPPQGNNSEGTVVAAAPSVPVPGNDSGGG